MAALLGFGALTATVAVVGSLATQSSVDSPWYESLEKPSFQPPAWVFGPVWTTLYTLMTASVWRVWAAPDSPDRTKALGLWFTQLALNGTWSGFFFGAQNPSLALVNIGAMLAAISAYAVVAARVDTTASVLIAPYLAWTGLASALNFEIVRLNPPAQIQYRRIRSPQQ